MDITHLRPTWIEVNLDAIKHNIKQVRRELSSDTKIMAVVKAGGYGHGAVQVAKAAVKTGVDCLGVATVSEGIKLRKADVKAEILILGTLATNQIEEVFEYDLTPTIYSYQMAKNLSAFQKELKIHIKIDTGMGRIGLLPKEARKEIIRISELPYIEIEGLFTHFAKSDTDLAYTQKQIDQFNQIIDFLKEKGLDIPLIHSSNSAAIINYPQAHYDLVRMGIILYGLYPDPSLEGKLDLLPALSWKAKIVNLKKVEAGRGISYGSTYITQKATQVGTLPVGYHDGYWRGLSGKTEVLIKGQRAEVIGTICMDQMMVDLTGIDVSIGDQVVLIGQSGEEEITATDLATKVNTINYEVISRIAPRVPRIFYQNQEVVAFDGEKV